MPRRRYYRRSVRVVPAKKKWASNIVQGRVAIQEEERSDAAGGYMTIASNQICANAAQGPYPPTPVILKTGNFKVQFDGSVEGPMDPMRNVVLYLMYVPEGVDVNEPYGSAIAGWQSVVDKHPEWILAWKRIDVNTSISGSAQAGNLVSLTPTTFSSRLKRNLNSGDQIRIVLVSNKVASVVGTTAEHTISIFYTCQFWTCSN